MRETLRAITEMVKVISPILIRGDSSSITLSLSKRFFLFRIMNKIINVIEEDPYLNFIALLKSYKVLGKFLNGTLHEFYRDRNKLYFKTFFYDRDLYKLVRDDLTRLYPKYKDVRMTITKHGLVIYDNYKKNRFNTLMLTVHAGSWFPKALYKKLHVSDAKRCKEEDLYTDHFYGPIVLEKGGIWIDNKQSRFLIDFNRNPQRAIYSNQSEAWVDKVWKETPTMEEIQEVHQSYKEFYFTLSQLIESYNFNIIFDGHSMNPKPGRPAISFGTKFIPKFYMPIVKSMQRKMRSLGYPQVLLNTPYSGGYIPEWLKEKFPNTFIFSMEVNKDQYMGRNGESLKPVQKKVDQLSVDLLNMFDISDDE